MELSLFNQAGLMFLLRWVHLFAGVTWIGLLYYFNFVQTEYFKEATGEAKTDALLKLAPRALWWFRWGAMLTFLSGAALLHMRQLTGLGIIVGAVLGTLMFLNVWLIIWPNQKVVISSARQVAAGGDPISEAGAALARAGLASRTNTLFSLPMLFFMASSVHLGGIQVGITSVGLTSLVLIFGLIAALELNGIFGKTGPMTSVKGVLHSSALLTVILYVLTELH